MAVGTSFRELARSKEVKLGTCLLEFTTPGIGYILKEAGSDFVFIDMEHSGFSHETVKTVLRYMEAAGLPSMVRPPDGTYANVAVAMDMGCDALIVPHIKSREDALAVIDHMKYAPVGRRGLGLSLVHNRHHDTEGNQQMRELNESVAFYATIEDPEAIENIDSIMAVDGVDGALIGLTDLSSSLGVYGQFQSDTFRNALAAVEAACHKYDKSYAQVPFNVEEGVEMFSEGADMLVYWADAFLLKYALKGPLDTLREQCKGPRGQKRKTAATATA